MTFQKGVSGNTKGRGIEKTHQKRLAKDLLGPHQKRAVGVIAELLENDDPDALSMKFAAAKVVLEYTLGKPQQSVELDASETLQKIILQIVK